MFKFIVNDENETYYTRDGKTLLTSSSGASISILREISQKSVHQIPTQNFTFSLPNAATDIADNIFKNNSARCRRLTECPQFGGNYECVEILFNLKATN